MYKKLARIGPISCGIFYALMFLLMVIIMAALGFILAQVMPNADLAGELGPMSVVMAQLSAEGGIQNLLIGLGGILIAGFLTGFLTAIVYNIVAMITGGIKIKTHDLGYDDI